MNDTLNNITGLVDNVEKNIVNPIGKVYAATSKTSLMRLTKDQVFQFPIIMDADIDDDEKYPIIKSIEKNYASIVMMAIVNEGFVDRKKYPNINKFLKRFHNNNDIPFDALKSTEAYQVLDAIVTEGYLSTSDLEELWDCIEEQLDTGSINNMYLPYKTTMAKLERALEAARETRVALEATDELYFRRVVYRKEKKGDKLVVTDVVDTDKDGNPKYEYIVAPPKGDAKYDTMSNKYGEAQPLSEWEDDLLEKQIAKNQVLKYSDVLRELEREERKNKREDEKEEVARTKAKDEVKKWSKGDIVQDGKYSNLTPTILQLTLANSNEKTSWSQNLILGVKAMPRFISHSLMVANMIEAFKDRLIFKFIKWTKGELSFADFLFGFSEAKAAATNSANNRWLKVLRKRSKKAKGFRLTGNSLNPNCTIIITETDAHLIYEGCGIDPHDPVAVRKVMDKYFLLGFGIYDSEAKMLKIIYDGESEFSHFSLRTLIAESKKDANLLSMNKY